MVTGHPSGLPDLFLDRSLGGKQVPTLLRDAGLRLRTLAEVYGQPADEDVADVDWLERAGRAGWAVLMKDDRIRYRPVERAALVAHGVRAFCLAGGNLRASAMAEQFLAIIHDMARACAQSGPLLYVELLDDADLNVNFDFDRHLDVPHGTCVARLVTTNRGSIPLASSPGQSRRSHLTCRSR